MVKIAHTEHMQALIYEPFFSAAQSII